MALWVQGPPEEGTVLLAVWLPHTAPEAGRGGVSGGSTRCARGICPQNGGWSSGGGL
ncbi:hypothetical protein PTTG_05832, partial [Puccinia triticina 1-1 BBBD Race 1]